MLSIKKETELFFILLGMLGFLESAHAMVNSQETRPSLESYYWVEGASESQAITGNTLAMPSPSSSLSGVTFNNNDDIDTPVLQGVSCPVLHVGFSVFEDMAVGLGVTTPFLTHSEWSLDENAAQNDMKTSFSIYNVGVDLAYAVTEKFSIGAGYNFVRALVPDYSIQSETDYTGYGTVLFTLLL